MRARGGLALGALVLLAACSSDPSPKPPPLTSNPKPSVSASPTPARSDDANVISGIVFGYFEALNETTLDGDISRLAPFRSETCQGCQRIESNIRNVYSAGGHIEGGQFTVKKVDQIVNPADGKWTFRVRAHVTADKAFATSAAQGRPHPAADVDFRISTVRNGNRAEIARLEILN